MGRNNNVPVCNSLCANKDVHIIASNLLCSPLHPMCCEHAKTGESCLLSEWGRGAREGERLREVKREGESDSACTTQRERVAREMMIAEQNAAYQESLAADREKLKKKEQQRLQEEEEREEREVSANKQCTLHMMDYNTMYKSWKLLRGKTMCKLQGVTAVSVKQLFFCNGFHL